MKGKMSDFFNKVFVEKIIIKNRVFDLALFLIPVIGVLIKNILLQAYNLGKNLYTPDFSAAVSATWKYWPYHVSLTIAILSVSLLFKKNKNRIIYVVVWDVLFTTFICLDVVYNRSFFTMPSIVDFYIFRNFSGFDGGEVSSLICGYDIIVFIDLIVLAIFLWKFRAKEVDREVRKKTLFRSGIISILICMVILATIPLQVKVFKVNTHLLEEDNAQRQSVYLSSFGYHIKDACDLIAGAFDNSIDTAEKKLVDEYFTWKNENLPDDEYAGIFEGKNVLFLQIESLETFVINREIDGQEITPNINKLTQSGFVFNNIYEQVQGGNSSDADLMYTTSRLPVTKGSTFFRFSDVRLTSLPAMLIERGYDTVYTQAVSGGFWNYKKAWKDMIGLTNFIGAEQLDMSGEKIGFTINDEDYLEQVFPHLEKLTQPYYAHVVCNSSHMPFHIEDESIKELKLSDELEGTYLGGYLQLCRYVDTRIGILLEKLEAAGLLENTVIVVTGDHTGIHKYYEYSLEEWYDEYPWVEADGYYTVPLIVSCDTVGKTIESDVLAGQIDVMPTLAYLMGIPDEEYMNDAMGRNLLKTERSYAIFRDGTIYSENLTEEELAIVKTSYDVSEMLFQAGE